MNGWSEEPSALERDLALDMLKELYEAVRFAEAAPETTPSLPTPLPSVSEAEEVEECALPAEEPAPEESEPQEEATEEPEEVAEESEEPDFEELEPFDFDDLMPVDEEYTLPEEQEEEPEVKVEEQAPMAIEEEEVSILADEPEEVVIEPAAESEPEEVVEPAVATETQAETETETTEAVEPVIEEEPEPAPATQNLFDMEELPVHRRSSRRALRSLYDEPESPKSPAYNETLADLVRQPAAEENPAPAVEQQATIEPEPQPAPVPAPATESAQPILNEVIHPVEPTLSESISPQPNIASTINENSSLLKMVALNDSYLLRNELFGGDRVAYEFGLAQLDAQPSLDDSLIYIAENYPQWNPNSDGVKLLLELLSRKFGEY